MELAAVVEEQANHELVEALHRHDRSARLELDQITGMNRLHEILSTFWSG
jgi:hypothetical protein